MREHREPVGSIPDILLYRQELEAVLTEPDWQITHLGIWLHCSVAGVRTPDAGWKLHLAMVPGRAAELLRVTVPIVKEHRCPFKCAADETNLKRLNSKNWSRGGSGKFMTIYPPSEEAFVRIGAALHAATRNFSGPYVLSDRRYPDSRVLSYRYGGFKRFEQVDVTGQIYAVFPAPDGSWYRDERFPYYQPPPWATDPLGLSHPVIESPVLRAGRFTVKSAIAFKNSGGVYLALDETNGQRVVVIKEARRDVHVAEPDLDAQTLLRKEAELLRELEGLGVAPALIDFFEEWENFFLAQERVPGMILWRYAAQNPIALHHRGAKARRQQQWQTMIEVFRNLSSALQILHDRGVAFGDLSPGNIMISEDRQVRLIDFEAACRPGIDQPAKMQTPGFAPLDEESWGCIEADLYALGALMLHYLVPSVAISVHDPSFTARALKRVSEVTPVPRGFMDLICRLTGSKEARPCAGEVCAELERLSAAVLEKRRLSMPPHSSQVLHELVRFLLSQVDINHSDRLAPSDRRGYSSHPLSLAYGAGGIADVLKLVAPDDLSSGIKDWMQTKARMISDRNCGPGYLAGMSGIAICLLNVGLVEEARAVLQNASHHPLLSLRVGLFHGMAGFGCAQLYFYQVLGDESYLQAASAVADVLVKRSERDERGMHWVEENNIPVGLGHGSSGVALLLLYLFAASGDPKHLEYGASALDFDLACGEVLEDKSLNWRSQVGGPAIYFPYYENGSAGIGSVLARYHHVTDKPRYFEILKEIRRAAIGFCVRPGLLSGLVGRGEFLADLAAWCPSLTDRKQMLDIVRGLDLFAVRKASGLAMPGDELTTLSCDFATGAAGAIALLHRFQTSDVAFYLPDRLLKNSTMSFRNSNTWAARGTM
jgi:serine/threonine protein kinase